MFLCSSNKITFDSVVYLDYGDWMLSEMEIDWSQSVQQSDIIRSNWGFHQSRTNRFIILRFSKVYTGYADVDACRADLLVKTLALPTSTALMLVEVDAGATGYNFTKATLQSGTPRIIGADKLSIEYEFLCTQMASV